MVAGPTRRRRRAAGRAFFGAGLLAFLLLDVLLVGRLIWQLPDASAWEDEPLYSFEHRLRVAERTPPTPQRPRIVVLGSSIAAYGVLPEVMTAELRRRLPHPPGQDLPEIILLGRQGLHWVQLRVLLERIVALEPALLIVPTNMIDFRLERPLALGLLGDLEQGGAARRAALTRLERDLYDRPRVRLHAPLGALGCCFLRMGGDRRADTIMATLFATYRYRAVWKKPLVQRLENRFARGRSYLHYAGVPVGAGSVTHRGRTGRRFVLPITEELLRSGLEFEAPPELHASGPIAILRWSVVADAAGYVRPGTACPVGAVRTAGQLGLKRGWQNLALRDKARSGDALCGALSRTWFSDLQADQLGLRLARNTGLVPQVGLPARRPLRREDLRYRDLRPEEYRRSYALRLERFGRPGTEYLHALRQAREYWRARAYDPELPAARAFAEFRRLAVERGIRLLVVNAPENPISLGLYGSGRWYRGQLEFLSDGPEGAAAYGFWDESRLLPAQMFYDSHHLSYFGAERFSRRLARLVPLEQLDRAPQTGSESRILSARRNSSASARSPSRPMSRE